jgi:hypothetical protein
MYKDRRAEARERAKEALGFPGYLLYGKEIIPDVAGKIPTTVGYLLDGGVVPRASIYREEQLQIREFETRAKESGLPILVEA